jgi:hypothetical protein
MIAAEATIVNDYRLYRLDAAGQIMLVELIHAADDDDAVQQAAELSRAALKCEIWQGNRLISKMGRANSA